MAKSYNDAAETNPAYGKMYGLEGDIRLKVWVICSFSKGLKLTVCVSSPRRNGLLKKSVSALPMSRCSSIMQVRNRRIFCFDFSDNNEVSPGGTSNRLPPPPLRHMSKAVSQDTFNNVFNTNAVGPYWLTFAFLPLLEKWKNSDDPAAKKFVPQVIMTSSMNGWTKVRANQIICEWSVR